MESHQKPATEWLQFCWDFVKPRRNSFATFFFLACSSARIFFYVICAACNFFFQQALAGNFFSKSLTPLPQELNGRPLSSGTFEPLLIMDTTFWLSVDHYTVRDFNSSIKACSDKEIALSSLKVELHCFLVQTNSAERPFLQWRLPCRSPHWHRLSLLVSL